MEGVPPVAGAFGGVRATPRQAPLVSVVVLNRLPTVLLGLRPALLLEDGDLAPAFN